MTTIVWFRNDLRVHDNPALALAAQQGAVVPVFIFDEAIITATSRSDNRNRFLLESLADLKKQLQDRNADIVIRRGDPAQELLKLVQQLKADRIVCAQDYTPYAIARDMRVAQACQEANVAFEQLPGRLILDTLHTLKTGSGTPYKVFTPFWRAWSKVQRREVYTAPTTIKMPAVDPGDIPKITAICNPQNLSPDALPGGETAGRQRLHRFLDVGIAEYAALHNDMAADATSRLSSYLHFGCLSALEIEAMLPDSQGAHAFNRQLAWRDFYNYVLLQFPSNKKYEFQERYRNFDWSYNRTLFAAWCDGKTGYPIVDAAMRQLKQEGWMHNRGRLIVGSFLTKDLGIDWRLGEQYFMQMLIDGDTANNNGNWQWVASVGVDPAPVFRRLYNPTSQAKTYDPSGTYIRRYLPELANVPDAYLAEPWTMSDADQQQYHCVIGKDYPAPVVDHAIARKQALERYRAA